MYSLYDRLTGNGLYLLSRLVSHTCRKQWVGLEGLQLALKSGRPVIATAWHGSGFMIISSLVTVVDPGSFSVLMPDDWRGGTLAVLTHKLGAKPFPLNLSEDPTLGMGRVLVRLVRHISGGGNFYIAPDGPDGPAYVPKPGVIYLAKKTNAIVVPVGGYCRNAHQLNRWDHYALPYPFSRISIHMGEPFTIERHQDSAEMRERLTDILHRVTAQATANYYAHRPKHK